MYVIKMKKYNLDGGFEYETTKQLFSSKEEAYETLKVLVKKELFELNEIGTPNYGHFKADFDGELDCVIRYWEYVEEVEGDNDYLVVTEYSIEPLQKGDNYMNTIAIYPTNSEGYEALKKASDYLNRCFNSHGFKFKLSNVWMDYGAGLMWTTIVGEYDDSEWQVLNPRDHEKIIISNGKDASALSEVKEYCYKKINNQYKQLKTKIDSIGRQLCFEYSSSHIHFPNEVVEWMADEIYSKYKLDSMDYTDNQTVIQSLINYVNKG